MRLSLVTALVVAIVFVSSLNVFAQERAVFRRGDANVDGVVDISDPAFALNALFSGGRQGDCEDAGDANDDGRLDISDSIYTLLFLFMGGPEPLAPGLTCGVDSTPDELDCARFSPCGHDGNLTEPLLLPADGCDSVVETLRAELTESMERVLNEHKDWLLRINDEGPSPCDFLAVADVDDGGGGGGQEAPTEFSETNNQVSGVDEADFVKTDGSFIYFVGNGRFEIVDSWPATDANKVASVEMDGEPKKLFIRGDRAIVYSSLGSVELAPQTWNLFQPWGGGGQTGDCTYGYDCDFKGDGRKLKASVFDISDRANPELLRDIEFSGSYLNSRRIDGSVYTVVVFPEVIVPDVRYWPEELEEVFRGGGIWDWCWQPELPFSDEEIEAMFASLLERNREVIDEASVVDFLPSIRDTDYTGDEPIVREDLLQDCDSFYVSQSDDGQTLLSLVTLDLNDDQSAVGATTVVGRAGAVYASAESLYIASRHYQRDAQQSWYFDDRETISEATSIHKFSFNDTPNGSSYVGSGVVKGRILNQFAMDEHEGFLRIATTTGRVPSPNVHSTVSVLESVSGLLTVVGQVDNIAPTEDIRSVRFWGESGYVVTFKKTDPLFVLDLADPRTPRIVGELKIPGFSTYMHRLDEDHILSIGYDADDQGSFAYFTGILLQIFDVSDPADPRLAHREVIGTRGSTSDAATDHLAFNFFGGLLGVPIVVCESSGQGGRFGDQMSFSGLLVYDVDALNGFTRLGGVPHEEPTGEDDRFYCGNWWTQSNSQVKRSIFMDDWVYSISLGDIRVSAVSDLGNPVSTITLGE